MYIFFICDEFFVCVVFLCQAASGGDNAPPPEAPAPGPDPAPAPGPDPAPAPGENEPNEPAEPDQENSHAGNKVIIICKYRISSVSSNAISVRDRFICKQRTRENNCYAHVLRFI